jgi:B12-binding domain/radical SAM domain protein
MLYTNSSASVTIRFDKKNMFSFAALQAALTLNNINVKFSKGPRDGIMIYSFASAQAQGIYHEVSEADTTSIFIAGGPHPSARPLEALEYFHCVVLGEGEQTLPELIVALVENRHLRTVRGIAFKEKGIVKVTKKRPNVRLDDFPPFLKNLKSPIEISRGCPYGCKYCQTPRLFGRKMRHRSVETISKYSQYLTDIRFVSSNSFAYGSDGRHANYLKIKKLLECLKGNVYFGTFPSEVRPEFISDDLLELVVSKCVNESIHFGAQSGSDIVLNEMERGHTRNDIEVALDRCLDHGLKPVVDFIFALPTETEEDQLDSLRLVDQIVSKGGKIRAHYFTPLPGTLYESESPSTLAKEVDQKLGKLARQSKLTGSWTSHR